MNIPLRVKNLVKKYGTSNPYKLCSFLKIKIRYADLGDAKGVFKIILGNKFILINEKLSEYSQKVVLCHELGHAILHSSKEIRLLKDYCLFPKGAEIEIQANKFAAELLYDDTLDDYEYNLDIDIWVLEELRKLKFNK